MVQELQITVFPQEAFDEDMLRKYLLREKGILPQELTALRILRRSIDARRRPVRVNLSLRLYLNEQPSERSFRETHYPVLPDTAPAAIVVGAGPAGLFAALRLIEKGIRPIIVERGKEVHSRRLDIARISREHTVDPDSNYSFGEGEPVRIPTESSIRAAKNVGMESISCMYSVSTELKSPFYSMHIPTSAPTSCPESSKACVARFFRAEARCIFHAA